ncbi:hypothetical protein D3C71_1397270 [compost metagenome]
MSAALTAAAVPVAVRANTLAELSPLLNTCAVPPKLVNTVRWAKLALAPPAANVLDSAHSGVFDTPVRSALKGLAIMSPIQVFEVKPATKVNVVDSVLVELEAILEPDALRAAIFLSASSKALANLSVSVATTKLPCAFLLAWKRSSIRSAPLFLIGSGHAYPGGTGLFGFIVPCRPMEIPNVTMFCHVLSVSSLARSVLRSVFQ